MILPDTCLIHLGFTIMLRSKSYNIPRLDISKLAKIFQPSARIFQRFAKIFQPLQGHRVTRGRGLH